MACLQGLERTVVDVPSMMLIKPTDRSISVNAHLFFKVSELSMHGQQRATASNVLVSSLSSPYVAVLMCRRHDGVKRRIGVRRDDLNNANNDRPLEDQDQRQARPLNAWRCDWRPGLQCTWR